MASEVTKADRDLLDAITGPFMTFKPKAKRERLQMIAAFRVAHSGGELEPVDTRAGARGGELLRNAQCLVPTAGALFAYLWIKN